MATPRRDSLKAKLDQLAERAVDRVLAKGDDATVREITDCLAAVTAYRKSTGANEPPPKSSAWEGYRTGMNVDKGPTNGARH
jgi:hypothetical protein